VSSPSILGDRTVAAAQGSFACVPPGVIHTFRNDSSDTVKFLNFNTPSGWENYMRDLAAAGRGAALTSEVIGRVAARYDFEVAH
jgi:oxalate decarboxylase/phosphoglucose isomerase-like protein (cupin superfamily)